MVVLTRSAFDSHEVPRTPLGDCMKRSWRSPDGWSSVARNVEIEPCGAVFCAWWGSGSTPIRTFHTVSGRSSTSEDAYSAQWGEKAVARAATSRTSATPGFKLPALESLLHVSSGSVYQLGVDEDLLYLRLGAVAAHVLLLENLSEAGFRL